MLDNLINQWTAYNLTMYPVFILNLYSCTRDHSKLCSTNVQVIVDVYWCDAIVYELYSNYSLDDNIITQVSNSQIYLNYR